MSHYADLLLATTTFCRKILIKRCHIFLYKYIDQRKVSLYEIIAVCYIVVNIIMLQASF